MITTDGYLWLALLAILGGVFTLGYALAERILGPERTDDPVRTIDQWPRKLPPSDVARYPGCVTCEGAESVGHDALIRHQLGEHSGGVRW